MSDRAAKSKTEIRITEKMLRHGVAALRAEMIAGEMGNSERALRDAATRVFLEMARVAPKGSSPSP